jgi:GDPmannose 4,6-dehydratase
MPEYTADVVGLGALRLLEAVRAYQAVSKKKVKFYQASSSEMFGATPPPQNENATFYPRSPYAAAKTFGFYMTKNYREAYGMFAVNGILFNHESPRRGETFVTRKVTRGIASILAGREKKIYLGNLDARRDWGYAPEYVKAMWMMLQLPKPEDFVIGTGESHSVKEFVQEAFATVGIKDWKNYVGFDERYTRPTEVNDLIADISKAKKVLKWKPSVGFKDLTRIMVKHDLLAVGLKDEAVKIKISDAASKEVQREYDII